MKPAPEAPIVQYWHEEVVPGYIEDILATFRRHNPGRRHLVFGEQSAQAFIEEHFGPRQVDAFRACAVPAMQADYLRYCAVLALGGVYCDVDERCIASLEPLLPAAGEGRLFLTPENGVINGFFAFGAPGHPFLELALEIASANIEGRLCDQVYFTTGPPIFTYLYWLHRLGSLELLLQRAAGSGFEVHFASYGQTVGEAGPASAAFERIQVAPLADVRTYLQVPDSPLSYKATDQHWTNAEGPIFRESSGRSASCASAARASRRPRRAGTTRIE